MMWGIGDHVREMTLTKYRKRRCGIGIAWNYHVGAHLLSVQALGTLKRLR